MSNKTKAIIAASIGALVQVANAVFEISVPEFVINSITGLAVFIAGLFVKAPSEKKS